MTTVRDTATLHRMLDPVGNCLTPEVARHILALRADPEFQARVDDLATRCNEGDLTPKEQDEYETYIHARRFIAILQARARKLLMQHSAG